MKVVLSNPTPAIFVTAYIEPEPLQGQEEKRRIGPETSWGGKGEMRFQKC